MSGLVAKATEDKAMLGITLMLFAYATFSTIDVSAKYLGALAIPALQLTFMRYLGHFLISLGLIAKGGISRERFGSEKLWLVALRGVFESRASSPKQSPRTR